MAVDDPAGLHGRVDRRRADEAEADSLQPPRQLLAVRPVAVLPHELVERRAGLAQRERCLRVRDRRLDLAAMADDPGVAEEPLDVAVAEARDALGIEAAEATAERLALAQDRDPGEPRLEALEAQPLVEAALVAYRPPPLLVVVRDVRRVGRRPAADRLGRHTDSLANDSTGNSEGRLRTRVAVRSSFLYF